MNKLTEIIEWLGVVLILLAYAAISFEILFPQNIFYQLMNLLGALGIMYGAYTKKDYQPVVLNLVWFLIALIAIINMIFLF